MAAEDKTQVSIRIPVAMLEDFESVARVLDRDRTWVMLRALRAYLHGEGDQLLNEAKGLEELDAGNGMDFDEVLDEADAIVAAARSHRRAKAG